MGSLASQSLWCDSTIFDHAIQFMVEGCGAYLAHSQMLETLLHQTGLEVKVMLIMYSPGYFKVIEICN